MFFIILAFALNSIISIPFRIIFYHCPNKKLFYIPLRCSFFYPLQHYFNLFLPLPAQCGPQCLSLSFLSFNRKQSQKKVLAELSMITTKTRNQPKTRNQQSSKSSPLILGRRNHIQNFHAHFGQNLTKESNRKNIPVIFLNSREPTSCPHSPC